jgi:hypothetical protein
MLQFKFVILSTIILNAIMLSVILLYVIMLNVVALSYGLYLLILNTTINSASVMEKYHL